MDVEKSFYWYSGAAIQGHAGAQHRLGCAYAEGIGVEVDDVRAFEWLSKAAEQGLADAQGLLGICYAKGRGVRKDHALARKWLGLACEKGVANAQFAYDLLYPDPVNGPRLPPGVEPGAVKLLKELARQEQCARPQNRQQRRAAERRDKKLN
jgi:TPR repeat protein